MNSRCAAEIAGVDTRLVRLRRVVVAERGNARVTIGRHARRSSVRQPLLDRQRRGGQTDRRCAAPARPSPYRWSAGALPRRTCSLDRLANRAAVVADVDDVPAALAPLLPRPDVHRRHAQERALANRDARVADDAVARTSSRRKSSGNMLRNR